MGYRKRDTQDLCSPYHQLETQTNNWNQALQKYCFEVWTPILWTRLKRGRWVTDLFLRKLCLIEQVMKYMDFRPRKPKVVNCITSSNAKERQNKVSSFPAFRSLLKKPPWPRELSCLSWGSRNLSLGSSADGRSAKMAPLVARARLLSATQAGWIGRPQKEPAILRTCFKVIGGEAHLASHPKSCMFVTIWYTFLQNSKIGPPHFFCVEHLCV